MNQLINNLLDAYQPEMIENLQKIIRINSALDEGREGAPFGDGIQRALEFILELGKEKGFECINFDNYACEISLGQGEESIGAVSHLDVVPEGCGWTIDPFGGEIIDLKIYGRGAVDDKGPLIAVFYACCAIKDSGLPLKKKIKHIIGTNEEKGIFPCIRYYKDRGQVPECGIVPDSWFPAAYAEKGFLDFQFTRDFSGQNEFAEGQIALLELTGGEALNIVAPEAKAIFKRTIEMQKMVDLLLQNQFRDAKIMVEEDGERLIITAKGKAAHASTPEIGDNAISMMLRFLQQFQFAPAGLCRTLHRLADLIGKDWDGTGLGIACNDHTGILTCNIGTVSYKDGFLCLKTNIRSPITAKPEDIAERLSAAAEKAGMKSEMLNYNPHFYMPEDHPLISLLWNVYREMTGDEKSKPVAHGGGSYARILENFVPFGPSIQGEELCFHKQDEFITCDRLLLLSKIYAEALYRLAE